MNANTGLRKTLEAAKGHEKEDSYAKNIFSRKEFLSVILQQVVSEYKGLTKEEIMDLIEGDTIRVGTEDVSMDAQNTIRGENTESSAEGEALSKFDVLFRSLLPNSKAQMLVNLHIDLEIQKTYTPGYPIIKRGIYYACREVSKQLRKISDKETGYKSLEKVYSIWLCLEDVPAELQNTVSHYRIVNYKNDIYGESRSIPEDEDCDLIEIVLVRLGKKPVTENEMIDMLQGIFSGDMRRALRHVPEMAEPDEKEVVKMLSMTSYAKEEGREEGRQEGREEGRQEGREEGRQEGFRLFSIIMKTIHKNRSWTNSQIAAHCGCDETDVASVRKNLDGQGE